MGLRKTTIRSIAYGGTQLDFPNGKTLSIMFGSANYGSNHHKGFKHLASDWEAKSVEVGIFTKDEDGRIKTWYDMNTLEPASLENEVAGWIPVDEALALIEKVRNMP